MLALFVWSHLDTFLLLMKCLPVESSAAQQRLGGHLLPGTFNFGLFLVYDANMQSISKEGNRVIQVGREVQGPSLLTLDRRTEDDGTPRSVKLACLVLMDFDSVLQQAHQLWWDHMPLPLIFAVALVMLTPLLLFKWGTYDPFLHPEHWKELPLAEKVVLNHNTRKFRFNLPYASQPLGLPLGQHISIKATADDGSEIIKPYTPVSDLGVRGHVDFVIKVYPQGRMSQAMDKLKIGDKLLFKGPKGRFSLDENEKRAIGMIAGGTGITPMYQVAKALLNDPEEHTTLSLIYANVTFDDILLREELDELKSTHSRFNVYYVLNEPPEGWSGGSGFVTAEMISQHLPKPAADVLVARCGPPAMNKAMRGHLIDLGYSTDMLFEF